MYRILEEIPLFDGINTSVLRSISQYISIEKYKRHDLIIKENQPNKHFYIIKKGEVKVFKKNKQGQDIVMCLLQDGDFFGEIALLDNNTASASVETLQPTELLCIHDRQFHRLLKSVPQLTSRLFFHMAQRIRSCNENIENLNRSNSSERVGAVLVQLAERTGYRKNSSVVIRKLPFQHNIASLVINDYPRFY